VHVLFPPNRPRALAVSIAVLPAHANPASYVCDESMRNPSVTCQPTHMVYGCSNLAVAEPKFAFWLQLVIYTTSLSGLE
jgi:hypothetical protein